MKIITEDTFITQRNDRLKDWVEKHYRTEAEKIAAWEMFHQICEMYPQFAPTLRGRIIDIQKEIRNRL